VSTSEFYIKTAVIRAAVKGRETDILKALGIQWNHNASHIACPYPDHPDHEPSWRWHDKRMLAFCSCIGTRTAEKKAHSIFDVIGAKEGLSFEAAKVRAAEVIGRRDLIIEMKARKYQRTDSVSLLTPQTKNRDDALVWNYLGYRLDINPDHVPRPTTNVVGLKSLAYFDSPQRKGGKPVHVVDVPAAVFETLDREGKRHAHRIYLSPAGTGKAELGAGPNGHRREPKKSARKTLDQSTAGLAVIWGNGLIAETEIIFEGIETAAAAALAFKGEIANGKIMIAACITASGMEAFKPWPSAKRVIVGADRDEAAQNGRVPTRRGEMAARKFAELHYGERDVSIALPGKPGEKLDWLDLLRRDGVEAVRSGLLAANPYAPTQWSGRVAQYEMRKDGLWYVDPHGKRSDLHLCGPISAAALTRDCGGCAWGLLLEWKDLEGRSHEWAMPRALLAGDGMEVRRAFLDQGLYVANGRSAREKFAAWLGAVQPHQMARCVARIGWHGDGFVLPDKTFGPIHGRMLLQTEREDYKFNVLGSLADWRQEVADLCSGNSRLMFSVSAAFVPPLIHLTDAESGGVHFKGDSSIGKTTMLEVAASVWGGGGVKGYVRQWRATDNGLEGLAAMHCDALLPLDEMSQIDAKAAGAAAYMLANGSGKHRAGRGGERRPPAEWRLLFLSTGEIGLADMITEDSRGRRIRAGQQVRIVDVPANAGAGHGIFENLHGYSGGDVFAGRLRDGTRRCYGTPARAFLNGIAHDREGISTTVAGFRDEFVSEVCPASVDGQVKRVAERFGLIAAAGELAIALGILPWAKDDAKDAAKRCFGDWLAARGDTGPAEIAAGIAVVRRFIEFHGEGRFADWDQNDSNRTIMNRAGFRRHSCDGGIEYLIFPEAWKEILAGFDSNAIGNALAAHNLLAKDSDGKLQSRHRNPETKKVTRFYLVKGAILGEEDDAAEAA